NFTTFASIMALDLPEKGTVAKDDPPEFSEGKWEELEAGRPLPQQREARLLFYFKPGCQECDRARQTLQSLAQSEPRLAVEEINIETSLGAESNEVLCDRFGVPDVQRGVTPA